MKFKSFCIVCVVAMALAGCGKSGDPNATASPAMTPAAVATP